MIVPYLSASNQAARGSYSVVEIICLENRFYFYINEKKS